MTSRYAITALLGTLLVGTVAAVGWETDWGQALLSQPVPTTTRSAALDTNILPPFALGAVDTAYPEMAERPLFISTRRPAPPANTTAAVAMKKGQFRLAGTAVNDSTSYVFLFELAANKTHRIAKGAEVNGIRVDVVDATRVVLKQGDEIEELRLTALPSPRGAQIVALNPAIPGAPGMPGVGGNIGLPNGAPQFPGGPPVNGMPTPINAGGFPVPGGSTGPGQFAAAGQVSAPVVGGEAANAPPQAAAVDPANPVVRRRRFQNLPQ